MAENEQLDIHDCAVSLRDAIQTVKTHLPISINKNMYRMLLLNSMLLFGEKNGPLVTPGHGKTEIPDNPGHVSTR